nr:MAG TPA: nuclease [Caudoviricetes sp.]
MNRKIGKITKKVIETLGLDIEEDTAIYIGNSNIEHIKVRHMNDYEKYGHQISNIIENPTYVARDEKKNSIEYIKKYIINKEMVLVVVRASGKKQQFVRTMYVMAEEKIEKYKKYGHFKKI